MIVSTEPAAGPAALAAAGSSERIAYASTDIRGKPTTMTGLVHLPMGVAPKAGWPLVTYGHMTTGGCDRAAPSEATWDHPELRRMTQGHPFIGSMLERGYAVVQPDYEGIGGPGPHPYLIGQSLARSVIDMAVAVRSEYPISNYWVSAGHSEGAVAALWAGSTAATDPKAEGLDLRGICAFTPVTRMDQTIGASLSLPVVLPGFAVVSPLIALMLSGAQTEDRQLAVLLAQDGLSERAKSVWSHLETRSLNELCQSDSWGAIAPRHILGPAGGEVRARLLASFKHNDVALLRFPRGLPMRVDAAVFDEVAPVWLTGRALKAWNSQGVHLTSRWWPASHSSVLSQNRAPEVAAEWVRQLDSNSRRG